eukprot:4104937-Prymnesium_polylepis.1
MHARRRRTRQMATVRSCRRTESRGVKRCCPGYFRRRRSRLTPTDPRLVARVCRTPCLRAAAGRGSCRLARCCWNDSSPSQDATRVLESTRKGSWPWWREHARAQPNLVNLP